MKILFFPKEKYDDGEVYFNDAEFVDNDIMEIINLERRERDKNPDSNEMIWNIPGQRAKSKKR